MADGIWFVYRAPYEGPTGIRVWRLPDRNVLGWFQRVWRATADEEHFDSDSDSYEWVSRHLAAELGGDVYGLSSLFHTNPERDTDVGRDRHGALPASTWQELRDLLDRDLYVEGDPERNIRVDQHSVRAKTDDDEVDLAYFFVDDELVRLRPDCAAYLLWEDWRLPVTAGVDRSGFQAPVPVLELESVPGGVGTTYLILPALGNFGDPPPIAFTGIRLPQLAEHLRAVVPAQDECRRGHPRWPCCWPNALLGLRAMVGPDERRIGPALRRYNRHEPLLETTDLIERVWRSGTQDHAAARVQLEPWLRQRASARQPNRQPDRQPDRQRDPQSERRDPSLSRIRDTRHLAQAAIHVHWLFGYERWYLFDDVWAASHPDLAASLLRCAASWDPFSP